MLNTERRIAALEGGSSDSALKIFVLDDGESSSEASIRVGLKVDALRVMWVTQLDVKL